MRVLFVSNCKGIGGAELVLLNFIKDNEDFESTLMAPEGLFLKKATTIRCDIAPSKGLREITIASQLWYLNALSGLIIFNLELYRLIRGKKPHIIHANGFIAGIFCLLSFLSFRQKPKLVWHFHEIVKIKSFESKLIRLLSSRITMVIAVSLAVKARLLTLGVAEEKIVVVYNGIDCEHDFIPRTIFNHNLERKIKIGMIGLLVECKGFHIFLSALKRLVNLDKTNIYIIGDSWLGKDTGYRKEIKEYAFNNFNNVEFMGWTEKITDLISQLDIVVHASIEEDSLPTVILEAMSMEKVVIASKVGGVPEIIDDKINGYVFTPGNISELATILDFCIDNYQNLDNFRLAARMKITNCFSESIRRQKMNTLYYRMLNIQHNHAL